MFRLANRRELTWNKHSPRKEVLTLHVHLPCSVCARWKFFDKREKRKFCQRSAVFVGRRGVNQNRESAFQILYLANKYSSFSHGNVFVIIYKNEIHTYVQRLFLFFPFRLIITRAREKRTEERTGQKEDFFCVQHRRGVARVEKKRENRREGNTCRRNDREETILRETR